MDPLEYLASYGWMIVIAVAVGALLWSMGVFSPKEPAFAREFSKVKILDYSVVQRGSEKTLYLHIAPLERDYRLVRVEIRDMEGNLLAEMEPRVVIPRMKPYSLEIKLSDHLSDYYRLRVYLVLESLQGIRSGDEGVISGRIVLQTEVDMDEKVKADPTDPTAGYLSEKIDGITLEVVDHRLRVKPGTVDADKVDGRDVDDTRVGNYLWTSQKIMSEVEKRNEKYVYRIKEAFVTSCYTNTMPRFWRDIERESRVDIPRDSQVLGSGAFFSLSSSPGTDKQYALAYTPLVSREVYEETESTAQDNGKEMVWLPGQVNYTLGEDYRQWVYCRRLSGDPEGMVSAVTYVGGVETLKEPLRIEKSLQGIRYLRLTDVGTEKYVVDLPDAPIAYFSVTATLYCDKLCFGYVRTPLGDIPLTSEPENGWKKVSSASLVLNGILYENGGDDIVFFLDNPGGGTAVLEVGYTVLLPG